MGLTLAAGHIAGDEGNCEMTANSWAHLEFCHAGQAAPDQISNPDRHESLASMVVRLQRRRHPTLADIKAHLHTHGGMHRVNSKPAGPRIPARPCSCCPCLSDAVQFVAQRPRPAMSPTARLRPPGQRLACRCVLGLRRLRLWPGPGIWSAQGLRHQIAIDYYYWPPTRG